MRDLFSDENPQLIPLSLRIISFLYFFGFLLAVLVYHIWYQSFGYVIELILLGSFLGATLLSAIIFRSIVRRRIINNVQVILARQQEVLLKSGIVPSLPVCILYFAVILYCGFITAMLIVGFWWQTTILEDNSIPFFIFLLGWNLSAIRFIKSTGAVIRTVFQRSGKKKFATSSLDMGLKFRSLILDNALFSFQVVIFAIFCGSVCGLFESDQASIAIFCTYIAIFGVWAIYNFCLLFKF